jgi:hypothetical protein
VQTISLTPTAANMTVRGRRPRARFSGVMISKRIARRLRIEGFGLFSCDVLGSGTSAGMKGLMRLTGLHRSFDGICITYYCRMIYPRSDVGAMSMVAR